MVIDLPPGKVSGQGMVRDANGNVKTGQDAPKNSKQEHDNGSNADQRR